MIPAVESLSGSGYVTCEEACCDDPGGMHGHGNKPAVMLCGYTLKPEEARMLAAKLFRAAEKAESK